MGEKQVGIQRKGALECLLRRLITAQLFGAKFLKEPISAPQARPGWREIRILFDAGYVHIARQRHVVQRSMETELIGHQIQVVSLRLSRYPGGRRRCIHFSGTAEKAADNKLHHSVMKRKQFGGVNIPGL
jgi:hypothetical protein